MRKPITIIITLAIVGCATTYSPEQLAARAQDKSDFDLCFDMVLPNPSEYSKQELMNRGVDCNLPSIKDAVIEKRQKQLSLGQALIAFGNSVQSSTNYPTSYPAYNLPDYSQPNTNPSPQLTKMWLLDRDYVEGTQKVCVYKNLGKVHYITHKSQWTPCKPSVRL